MEPTKDTINRRSALGVVCGSAVALGAGITSLILGFVGNALRRKPAESWFWAGPVDALSTETFQRIVVSTDRTHAWIQKIVPMTIYVRDRRPEEPLALLSVCSHLGCSVNWHEGRDSFECPCHLGIFDREGNVVDGPPPKPLTRLETKVEGEALYVRLPDSGIML
jgi:Rieske Fe-S protein